jgi:hypothetical protein
LEMEMNDSCRQRKKNESTCQCNKRFCPGNKRGNNPFSSVYVRRSDS